MSPGVKPLHMYVNRFYEEKSRDSEYQRPRYKTSLFSTRHSRFRLSSADMKLSRLFLVWHEF